jgi:formate-dependent nitrite reductase membrane component NrfD
MALYLLTKGIGTGTMLISAILWWLGDQSALTRIVGPAISVAFIIGTAVLLVVDLERPERFYYILLRPNWRSWMVWGAYFLTAHGAITTLWLAAGWFGLVRVLTALVWPAVLVSILATCYTGFLFAQGLARDLWQGPHATFDLLAQAVAEGAALLILASLFAGGPSTPLLTLTLLGAMVVHLGFISVENLLTPSPTRHHELAVSAITRGPFSRLFWGGAMIAGGIVPILVLLAAGGSTLIAAAGAILALGGSFAWEYIWVEAGQSVPLS